MVIANDTVKVLHVLAACLFLGNVVVSGTWAFMAERTRNFEVVSFSNRLVLITDLMFTLTGALLVVYTGSLMSQRYAGAPAASQAWISWSYMLFGLSGAIWALVLVPIQLRQRVLLNRHLTITPEYLKLSRIWQISGAVATIVPLPIVYLMIVKGI
ncbi:MAG: DUF2269 family protein [Polaromonas sp.]|jgi:uncharacterized membrane protein